MINIAVREINDKLGYHVTYEDVKSSRKIVGFKFKIESQNNIFRELSHENTIKQIADELGISSVLYFTHKVHKG